MTKPTFELKNIQYSKFASQETECYQADLWVDGVKIGTVKNDGQGGPDYFWGDEAAWKKANDWCTANLPKEDLGFIGYDGKPAFHQPDLENICGDLLTRHLYAKDLKRSLRSKVLVAEAGAEQGVLSEYSWKGVRKVTKEHIARVRAKRPDDKILNDMPFEAALSLYIPEAA